MFYFSRVSWRFQVVLPVVRPLPSPEARRECHCDISGFWSTAESKNVTGWRPVTLLSLDDIKQAKMPQDYLSDGHEMLEIRSLVETAWLTRSRHHLSSRISLNNSTKRGAIGDWVSSSWIRFQTVSPPLDVLNITWLDRVTSFRGRLPTFQSRPAFCIPAPFAPPLWRLFSIRASPLTARGSRRSPHSHSRAL